MTSFIPDKPGWYWEDDCGTLVPLEVIAREDGKLIVWVDPDGEPSSVASFLWKAPVTRPDVVADLVAALEAVINQDVDRYEKAHDALRRYREG